MADFFLFSNMDRMFEKALLLLFVGVRFPSELVSGELAELGCPRVPGTPRRCSFCCWRCMIPRFTSPVDVVVVGSVVPFGLAFTSEAESMTASFIRRVLSRDGGLVRPCSVPVSSVRPFVGLPLVATGRRGLDAILIGLAILFLDGIDRGSVEVREVRNDDDGAGAGPDARAACNDNDDDSVDVGRFSSGETTGDLENSGSSWLLPSLENGEYSELGVLGVPGIGESCVLPKRLVVVGGRDTVIGWMLGRCISRRETAIGAGGWKDGPALMAVWLNGVIPRREDCGLFSGTGFDSWLLLDSSTNEVSTGRGGLIGDNGEESCDRGDSASGPISSSVCF